MIDKFRTVFKSKNAILMLLASITSLFGDWSYFIALTVHLNGNNGIHALAIMTFFRFSAAFLIGPVSGAILERLPKKVTMIVLDLLRVILMLILALTMIYDKQNVWLVIIIATVSSILGTIFSTARRALLPTTIPPESRLALNALDGSLGTITLTLAPAIAGVFLMWTSPAIIIILNGVSFLVSAFLLYQLDMKIITSESDKNMNKVKRPIFFLNLKEGFFQIINTPDILAVTVLSLINHIAAGASWILIPLICSNLNLGASGVGYLSSAIGLGSMIGMFIGGIFGSNRELKLTFNSVLLLCLSMAIWALLSGNLIGALFGATLVGLTANLFEAPCWSLLQKRTDPKFYTRVFSSFDAISLLGLGIGTQLASLPVKLNSVNLSIQIVVSTMICIYLINFIYFKYQTYFSFS